MEKIGIILFIVFSSGYLNTSTSAYRSDNQNAPIIHPNEAEYTVKVGHNVTLRCEGNQQLTWDLPKMTDHGLEPAKASISISETPDLDFPYGVLLEMFNVSVVDVGYYTCLYNTTDVDSSYTTEELEKLGKAKRMYLFVDDPENTLVPSETIITGIENDNVIIPCRPTSPKVNVTLMIGEDKVTPNSAMNSFGDRIVRYDQFSGFTLPSTLIEDGNFLYNCTGNSDTSSRENIFMLSISIRSRDVPKPSITDHNNGRVHEGNEINLNCSVKVEKGVSFILEWEYPNAKRIKDRDIFMVNAKPKDILNSKILAMKTLRINNATKEDQGKYNCTIRNDNQQNNTESKLITVHEEGTSSLRIYEKLNVSEIILDSGEDLKWIIEIDSFPLSTITWYDNKYQEINAGWVDSSKKYNITTNSKKSYFRINSVVLSDSGIYQIKADNGIEIRTLNLTVIIKDKPKVKISSNKFYMNGTYAHISCNIDGYPNNIISWKFKPCTFTDCSSNSSDVELQKNEYTHTFISSISSKSITSLFINTSGYLSCNGKNDLGSDIETVAIYATDVKDGFGIIENTDNISVGENVNITCAESIYKHSGTVNWYNDTDDSLIHDNLAEGIRIIYHNSTYSRQAILSVNNIKKEFSGIYTCKVTTNNGEEISSQLLTLNVSDTETPKILETNMNSSETKYVLVDQNLNLYCKSKGVPSPITKWFKDGELLNISKNNTRIHLRENGTKLTFDSIEDKDQGQYLCRAINRIGEDYRHMDILLHKQFQAIYIAIIVGLIIIFIILISVLIYKIRKEKEIRRELSIAGLLHFKEGATESLNPDLGVDEQAELLPYDKKWEFPREKLKLGKQLGSGAFGVVMKAVAYGICREEDSTTVAVKMVKRSADAAFIKALASELKIMVHLGKHLNVVNLLGACTKNVTKRELFVIVEYCRYGNLHNYLLRHREHFIDQINPKSGYIDVSIGSEAINRAYSISSNRSSALKSANQPLLRRSSSRDSTGNTELDTTNTAISMVPNGDDVFITSSGSQQPEWRSNYRGDYNYSREVRPISTQDLICWSFQISRGMEYLANRKVMHGDLAARNILLADDNIVKICDFGLAKSIYKCDNYKKKGDGPLPVKWMAVESIRDRVFSTQSDIWAFGIVLWELFSLARTPYPGIEADEKFYISLIEGYRMDKPQYANDRIYKIMTECWLAKPIQRPTFTDLAEKFGIMLEEGVRKYYIDLNDPYMEMNHKWLAERGDNDYLTMLSSPDYSNFTSTKPEYVNEPFGGSSKVNRLSPDDTDTEGYLRMSPASNSALMKNSDIFVFAPHKTKDDRFDSTSEQDQRSSKSNSMPMAELISINNLPQSPNVGSNPTSPKFTSVPTSPTNSGISNQTYKSTYPNGNNKCDLLTNDMYLDMSPKQNGFGSNGVINELTTGFSNPSYVTMQPNGVNKLSNVYNNIPSNIMA